ncbi:MAG: 4Fe-4S dicluster domain-containing protein [Spirochaetaceae bacterium]|jgi:2-oxoglutarate ferredoxin oxidoreductase subunit delta|nr:4Fe-4S dicluster domain-containing protein [Spirochaetaceae bacterium]
MAKRGKVLINRDLCKGCLLCIRSCPARVLEQDTEPNKTGSYPSKATEENIKKCIACGNCFEVCPDICIEVYEQEEGEAV